METQYITLSAQLGDQKADKAVGQFITRINILLNKHLWKSRRKLEKIATSD